jgi:hypothetical protein
MRDARAHSQMSHFFALRSIRVLILCHIEPGIVPVFGTDVTIRGAAIRPDLAPRQNSTVSAPATAQIFEFPQDGLSGVESVVPTNKMSSAVPQMDSIVRSSLHGVSNTTLTEPLRSIR